MEHTPSTATSDLKNTSSSSPVNSHLQGIAETTDTSIVKVQDENPKLYSSSFFFISSRTGLTSPDRRSLVDAGTPISPKEEVESICASLSRNETEYINSDQKEFVANVSLSFPFKARLLMLI